MKSLTRKFALALLLAFASSATAAPTETSARFAVGTPYETEYLSIDSGCQGPTMLFVGSLGTEVPERERYLREASEWPLVSGRLVILPRFFPPKAERDRAQLTRAFPSAAEEEPDTPAASALWDFVREIDPDFLVQLSGAGAIRSRTGSDYGNTLISRGGTGAANAAIQLADAANQGADDDRWLALRNPVRKSLVRAAADALLIDSIILYPSTGIPREESQLQLDKILLTLLHRMEMIDPEEVSAEIALEPEHRALGEGKRRVAVFNGAGVGGNGIPNILASLAEVEDVYAAVVHDAAIRRGVLADFDVVVFPGGSGSRQAGSLGEAGRKAVVEFVESGGGYFGVCAGAYLACANYSWSLGLINAKTRDSRWRRGRGEVELEITPEGLVALGGESRSFPVRYANGPIIEPAAAAHLPPYETWAYFRTELAENDTPAGIMVDTPAFASAEFGKGRVVIFSPHPESSGSLRYTVNRAVDWLTRRQ